MNAHGLTLITPPPHTHTNSYIFILYETIEQITVLAVGV